MDTCKKILEGAGVLDHDNDGRLEYMSGSIQEIELSFLVCSDSSAKAGVANRFAEIMDSIGLTVVSTPSRGTIMSKRCRRASLTCTTAR